MLIKVEKIWFSKEKTTFKNFKETLHRSRKNETELLIIFNANFDNRIISDIPKRIPSIVKFQRIDIQKYSVKKFKENIDTFSKSELQQFLNDNRKSIVKLAKSKINGL